MEVCTFSFIERIAGDQFTESEFWFASGKVILAVGLIFFTFVTMVGGNPIHDAYGFRFWNRRSAYPNFRHYLTYQLALQPQKSKVHLLPNTSTPGRWAASWVSLLASSRLRSP